jgi:hypothetical protein
MSAQKTEVKWAWEITTSSGELWDSGIENTETAARDAVTDSKARFSRSPIIGRIGVIRVWPIEQVANDEYADEYAAWAEAANPPVTDSEINTMAAATFDLPPNKTYKVRRVQFLPQSPDLMGTQGYLAIVLARSDKPGAKQERDVYAIQTTEAIGFPGKAFMLLNTVDPEQPDVYRTIVSEGARSSCTCKAAMCGLICKHVDAIRELVRVRAI